MRIAIGVDHGGYPMKGSLIAYLKKKGHNILDVGCFSPEPCDYPEFGYRVASLVNKKRADRGILICKSGIGHSIVANKVRGIRAALCYTEALAKSSRKHNDANVLVLGARHTDLVKTKKIISVWLSTRFLGGRHARRVKQIAKIERKG